MAPLFSKADLNKFWRDIQNEVSLICAKFGKDPFNISKVIGRKTKFPRFFGLLGRLSTVYTGSVCYTGPCHKTSAQRVERQERS